MVFTSGRLANLPKQIGMTSTRLRNLKKGEIFRLNVDNKPFGPFYVRGHFDRSTKRYSIHKFDDVNAERFVFGGKAVWIGETF
jgi:hypothetical protein